MRESNNRKFVVRSGVPCNRGVAANFQPIKPIVDRNDIFIVEERRSVNVNQRDSGYLLNFPRIQLSPNVELRNGVPEMACDAQCSLRKITAARAAYFT